jgi:DNA-binding beta-propeller fold protein YncE
MEEGEGLSNRRSIARLIRFIFVASVVGSLAVALMSSGGCGKGLFPEVTPTSGTVTPTPVTNAFLYATNFNDGTVSAFTRDTNTGALGFIAKHSAGAASGPEGIAVTPQNDLAFIANASDGKVYEYSVAQSGTLGDLTSIGSITSGLTPQLVAIDSSGSFVYVTNATSKTVTEYVISAVDGTLSLIGTVPGFGGKPFGIIAHPTISVLYVTDNTLGLIYTYTIANSGILTQLGSPLNNNGASRGQPGQMAIAFDGSQGYLFVDDLAFGVVSVFLIQANGSLLYGGTFGTSQSKPIGIGAVNNVNNYVVTANMTGNFIQPFQRSGTTLTQLTSVADATGPTGLVIDPAGQFAYTGNSGSGTIALIGINKGACGKPFCVIKMFASESPANSGAGTQFVTTSH